MNLAENSVGLSGFISLFVLFLFLSLGLVLWMVILRKRTHDLWVTEKNNNEHLEALLKSRGDHYFVFLNQNDMGVLSSENSAEFFGLKTSPNRLDDLKDLMSQGDFSRLQETITKARLELKPIEEIISLKSQKTVEFSGSPFNGTGYIFWIKDVTVREQIERHQEKMSKLALNQENQFKTTADILTFPIWIRDEHLKIKWANKAYVEAVEAETLVDVLLNDKELLSSAQEKSSLTIARKLKSPEQRMVENHTIVTEGERRAVEIHNLSYLNGSNQVGVVGYALDVTELEKAKTDLLHHTKSYSETLKKLSTAVAIFDSDRHLDYFNIAFLRLWDLPESFLLNQPHFSELLDTLRDNRKLPEQVDFPKWKKKQLEAYVAVDPIEEMWVLPDERTLRVVAQPHPLGGLLIFYEDVTDYLNLEMSLNTLNAVQVETLNNLHEAVAVFGVDGRLKLSNPGFSSMWNLPNLKPLEQPHITDILALSAGMFDNITDIDNLKKLIVGGSAKQNITRRQITLSNDRVIDYAAIPLPDGAVLMTYLDVTDQFRVEEALRERNIALEESDNIKTDFLAHMSYELRNPLTSIIGFSEMLEQEYLGSLNDKQKTYMGHILKASGHLFSLINDILDLTTIEAGGIALELSDFNLPDMMREVEVTLADRILQKKVSVEINYPKDLNVTGDEKRLQHCFYNLLNNAVKFTEKDGKIVVWVESDSENYTIQLTDTGVGIQEDEMDKIYEKFYVGQNVPKGQGAGLGLSLVKNFIELHGGEIEITSELGKGTKVKYRLPVHPVL